LHVAQAAPEQEPGEANTYELFVRHLTT